MIGTKSRQKGQSLVEFVLAGIPAIFLVVSVVDIALGMWNYESLSRAVNKGARMAAVAGARCSANGNSCTITVGTLTTAIANSAIGVPQSGLIVTLVTDSGATTTCNPISSCTSSTTTWPPSTNSDNQAGKKVTVTAKYKFSSALAMFWPASGGKVKFGSAWLPASSTQYVLF